MLALLLTLWLGHRRPRIFQGAGEVPLLASPNLVDFIAGTGNHPSSVFEMQEVVDGEDDLRVEGGQERDVAVIEEG